MKCFYHSADLDGRCSGAIVKLKFPEAELIGINYGEPFPWDTISEGESLYMVDFSLQPFSDMVKLNRLADLVWIDHHKSALLECALYPEEVFSGLQRIGEAGCELTWQWCFGDSPMPRAVYLLGRYDVWDWMNVPGALEFQYGMRQFEDCSPENTIFWLDLFFGLYNANDVRLTGEALLAYETKNNSIYAGVYGFDVEFSGLRCVAVNKGCANSLLFKSVYDPEKHDAMLSFCRSKRGDWKVSLYADKPEVDVSVIAKSFGGGGHKGAAGFQVTELPF